MSLLRALLILSPLSLLACGQEPEPSPEPTTTNGAPQADVGEDRVVEVGQTVALDALASSDPDGDTLSFSWQLAAAPDGSAAALSEVSEAVTSITPDKAGDYVIAVTVSDGIHSDVDSVTITAQGGGGDTSSPSPTEAPSATPTPVEQTPGGTPPGETSTEAQGTAPPETAPEASDPPTTETPAPSPLSTAPEVTPTPALPTGAEGTPTVAPDTEAPTDAPPPTPPGHTPTEAPTGDPNETPLAPTLSLDLGNATTDVGTLYDLSTTIGLTYDGSGTLSWQWELLDAPAGAGEVLLLQDDRAQAFIDVTYPGDYVLELTVSDSQVSDADVMVLHARSNPDTDCVLISEYVEGTNSNRALELYNCGELALDLSSYQVCVYIDSTGPRCLPSFSTGAVLDPGKVYTLCNTNIQSDVKGRCDQLDSSLINFNGDDRPVVQRTLEGHEALIDAFGDPQTKPPSGTWMDVTWSRCDLVPYTGGAPFDPADHYRSYPVDTFSGLGQPPSDKCLPKAVAQVDFDGEVIHLNGSSSSPGGGVSPLSFVWAVTQRPSSSMAQPAQPFAAQTALTPDIHGIWTFTLVVANELGSDSDTVSVEVTLSTAQDCLIISEYMEGSANNKALEIYNCGGTAVDLTYYEYCLIADAATTCTSRAALSSSLPKGEVYTLCHTQSNAEVVPPELCDLLTPAVAFNGDDRVAVREISTGRVLDALGELTARPPASTWKDLGLERCNPTPWLGLGTYTTSSYFLTTAVDTFSGLGSYSPGDGVCP